MWARAATITARCGSGSSAHRSIERSEALLSFRSDAEFECRNSTQVQSCRVFGKAICESTSPTAGNICFSISNARGKNRCQPSSGARPPPDPQTCPPAIRTSTSRDRGADRHRADTLDDLRGGRTGEAGQRLPRGRTAREHGRALCTERSGQEETLPAVTTHSGQGILLRSDLDALGDQRHVQLSGQPDDRFDERAALCMVSVEMVDERLVDLEDVERELAQMAQ